MHEEDDDVVQEPERLVVVAADHLEDHFGELLRAQGLGRVQPAVDPDHGPALTRERARLFVGQVFREPEPARDLAVALEVPLVLR